MARRCRRSRARGRGRLLRQPARPQRLARPARRAAELSAPILALQAGDDQNITAEQNAAFDDALTAAGIEHEVGSTRACRTASSTAATRSSPASRRTRGAACSISSIHTPRQRIAQTRAEWRSCGAPSRRLSRRARARPRRAGRRRRAGTRPLRLRGPRHLGRPLRPRRTADPEAAVAQCTPRCAHALPRDLQLPSPAPDVDPATVARFITAAHAAGIRVVAWYLPTFGRPRAGQSRALAAIRFRSSGGDAFDAFALDIESARIQTCACARTGAGPGRRAAGRGRSRVPPRRDHPGAPRDGSEPDLLAGIPVRPAGDDLRRLPADGLLHLPLQDRRPGPRLHARQRRAPAGAGGQPVAPRPRRRRPRRRGDGGAGALVRRRSARRRRVGSQPVRLRNNEAGAVEGAGGRAIAAGLDRMELPAPRS